LGIFLRREAPQKKSPNIMVRVEIGMKKVGFNVSLLLIMLLAGCQASAPQPVGNGLKVLVVETFLADITRNVAGSRASVDSLVPIGLDPHAFEPAPKDVARLAESQVLVVNGAGLESWLQPVLANVGGQRQVIVASNGLKSRSAREGEMAEGVTPETDAGDPHFWLDPLDAVTYVENIRDGLTQADPGGKETYASNATGYIARLKDLDTWVTQQVAAIPPAQRLLVTNHESLGYFADRYGFKVIGTIIPSVSTDSSPSAQELARLVDQIRASGVHAIFLEIGSNPQLAQQVSGETGVKVVTDIYTHSITPPNGPAPTYIDMIKADVTAIVKALRP
jgi:ABC-type Zn uptake system ZnuABC Zn-binding protein ZnuA